MDPHIAPVPLRDPAAVAIRGLRVVWFADNGIETPTPETISTVRAAADALRDAGAILEERVPPDQRRAAELWDALIPADGYAWLWRLLAEAGTEGHGSYEGKAEWLTDRAALPGDELSALVEAVDDVRAEHAAVGGGTSISSSAPSCRGSRCRTARGSPRRSATRTARSTT